MLAPEVEPETIESSCRGAWIANEQSQHAYGDAAIGDVEDRTEKGIRRSTTYRKPLRQYCCEEGEVEHVNHMPLKPRGIPHSSSCRRNKLRHLSDGGGEELSIEDRVNEIANASRQHQSDDAAEAQRVVSTLPDEACEPYSQSGHGYDAKGGQEELAA